MAGTKAKTKIRRVHTPEFRGAVMAALLAGQGVTEVARTYKLPLSTVSRWRKQARAEVGRTEDIGGLLTQLLHEILVTLKAQVQLFKDPEWIHAQDASDAGVLFGIETDKAVRLLEAMEPPKEQTD